MEKARSFLADDTLNIVHVGPQVHAGDLAADLAALCGEHLEVALLSCTGGEAIEAAIKLARAASRRSRVLYTKGGFHGTGLGPLSVMGHGRWRDPFEPLVPECAEIPFGDLPALEAALKEKKVACYVVEPIQAEAGIILPPDGYFKEAQALCRKHGALLVLDEVQTGLGRCGATFAYEEMGFVPDVLVLGKALGGGLVPISATLASSEVHERAYGSMDKFDLHGTTYSGNAFACRVAREVLRTVQEDDLPNRAERAGQRLMRGLRERTEKHPLVKDLRGMGLLVGLELGPTQTGGILSRLVPGLVELVSKKVFGQWLALRLLERGVLAQPASQQWNVLKLEPPLTVDDDEIDRVVRDIGAILDEYSDLLPLLRDVSERVIKQGRGGWTF
jgi:putrescine aminotransferase